MWDKLNFFGWAKKKPAVQPVQREVSITLTNGDRRETIQRSPSGTKLASSSTKHGLDDDNSSEASTSLHFGFKSGSSPRRSSFPYSREPLDLPTWSNVTSPGFTSRLVQQASGGSPLKEYNDSLSHSPFRKSPYREFGLGELPYVSYARKTGPSVFPSPQKTSSLKSGVSSSIYNRDRRRNARQGQTFVRIAPIDPSVKANVSISRTSSSPPLVIGSNGSPYTPRVSSRASEPYRQEGLGGIPQQELAMRFNRLWPSSPGGPVPGPGRPSSPTSPSNIVDALTSGRKRTREQEPYYPPNATPPSVSPPSKISIGIGDTPVRPQVPKRVKFLAGHDGHDRPMMVGYGGMGASDSEPLSSESILEQMNQTEKRFLPDSTSTPYHLHKNKPRMPVSDDQCSTLHSALRKRRSQSSIMGAVEEEIRGEKVSRFCTCNECYAEAAGTSMSPSKLDLSHAKDGSVSPRASDEKSTNTAERSRETCDKGVSTIEFDRGAYFRDVFRKADKKKQDKDDIDELMPYGKTVITKEMYEKDKRKRIERYYRILKMKPPGGNIFDPCPVSNSATVSADTFSGVEASASSASSSEPITGSSSSVTTNGFNFGAPTPSPSGGFPFGKQTSPIAQTVTTSACSTISSPSSTGSLFGSSTLSSTAPTMSTRAPFGAPSLSTTVTPSTGIPSFRSPPPIVQGLTTFSGGKDSVSFSNPVVTAESSASSASTTTTNATGAGNSGGFGFSAGAAGTTAVTSVPTFGLGVPSSTLGTVASNSGGSTTLPTFSGFGAGGATSSSNSIVGSGPVTTSADNNSKTPVAPFTFGKPLDSTTTTSISGTATGTSNNSFSFGSSNNNQGGSTSTVPSFGQSLVNPSDTVDNKSTSSATGGFTFSGGLPPVTTPAPTLSNTSAGGIVAGTVTDATNLLASNTATEINTASNPPPYGSGSLFGTAAATTSTAPSASFGSAFGSSTTTSANPGFSFGSLTTTAPTSNSTNPTTTAPSFGSGGFGSPAPATTTTITSITTAFGQASAPTFGSSQQSSSSPGGFSFTSLSNPLANKSATSSTTTTTPAFGQFGTTPAAVTTSNSTFGALTSTTPAPSFGNTSTPAPSFGNTTTQAPSFGNTTTQANGASGLFGQTGSTGTFGSTFGSSAPSAAAPTTANSVNSSFTFGRTASSVAPTSNSGATTGSTFSAASPPSGSAIFGSATGGTSGASSFGQPAAGVPFGSTTTTTTSSGGGFNFAAVPNPLAGNKSTTSVPSFSTFGSQAPATTVAASPAPPAFGSSSTTGSVFGGANNNSNSGFGFGGSTAMSPPQAPSTASGFPFGSPAPQPSAPPPLTSSSGFSFGQAANTAVVAPTPAAAPGVFQFGQQPSAAPPAAAVTPFQFGQQAAQGVPGGFNFAASAPAPSPGGQPMFSMGSASTAPRRRDRRRHR